MKNVLFILVCLFTSQAFGQQTMKSGNQGKTQKADAAAGLAEAPNKVVISSTTCPVEGYKITLSRDVSTGTGVSEKRYLGVVGIRNTFYATAAQASVLSNFPGLPSANNQQTEYNGAAGYISITYVNMSEIDPLKKYCDKAGFRIPINFNLPGSTPIYIVSQGTNNQQWSGLVEITSGSNLDGASAPFLVKTYNNKRGFVGAQRIPEKCLNSCYNASGSGVNPTGPDVGPTTWVDASGVEHDWFEDNGVVGGIGGSVIGSTHLLNEKLSLVAGAISNSFGDDVGNSGYVNQAIGAHLGLYVPLTTKYPVSVGVYVSGEYLASNKDGFRHEPAGFEVNGMPSTVKASSDGKIKQSLMMLGAGPQVNVGLGRKISLSTIVQGGVASFKQSGFSFIQEFKEGDMAIPVEIFNQKETKSTNFFWTPRLKISYAITSKIGVWAEGNYMMGNIEANQSHINPGEPTGSDGKYSFGQVNGSHQIENIIKYSLKGPGAGAGIKFSLSK